MTLVQFADVDPAAMIYLGVPLVGILGAGLTRFRPGGMAPTLTLSVVGSD